MPPTRTRLCLECREWPAVTRGVCCGCYSRLARQVRDGRTTWAELEKAGRARPRALAPRREKRN